MALSGVIAGKFHNAPFRESRWHVATPNGEASRGRVLGTPLAWRGGKDFGVGDSKMETIVLILGIAMAAPLPLEEIVGGYGRLALAVLGFLLISWWLFKNEQKKDLRGEL